jgi:hypothetical protein
MIGEVSETVGRAVYTFLDICSTLVIPHLLKRFILVQSSKINLTLTYERRFFLFVAFPPIWSVVTGCTEFLS